MKLIETNSEEETNVTISDEATSNDYTWDGEATVGEVAEAYAAKYDADFSTGRVRIRMQFADETVWGSFGADRQFVADNENHY
jgi:hypothetical protein